MRTGGSLTAVLAGAALLWAVPVFASGNYALLVGNNVGLESEAPLQHTSEDVTRLETVLRELGGFAPSEVRTLQERTAAEVLAALDQVAAEKPTTLYFFYSGHADGASLHLRGTRLVLQTLLDKLARIDADLKLVVLDACQSGSLTTVKGTAPGPAFSIRIEPTHAKGQVLISSSAMDERSYESAQGRGAVFSSHWTAGLRGAADSDGNQEVTLSEAYRYAYSQTLRSTLLSISGPQHPTFRWDLSGQRDPVLTRLGQRAAITFSAEDEALYLIFDRAEREVVAEVQLGAGKRTRLSLAPGEYVVRKRTATDVRVGRVVLGRSDDRVLQESQLQSAPMVRLTRKGAFGDGWITFSAGQMLSTFHTPIPGAQVGVEWSPSWYLFGADVLVSHGTVDSLDLPVQWTHVAPKLYGLARVSFGVLELAGGPLIGLTVTHEVAPGDPKRTALAGLVGGRARIGVSLRHNLALMLSGDVSMMMVRTVEGGGGMPLGGGLIGVLWSSYSLGLRLAF